MVGGADPRPGQRDQEALHRVPLDAGERGERMGVELDQPARVQGARAGGQGGELGGDCRREFHVTVGLSDFAC